MAKFGTRAQVLAGSAERTKGGLAADDLVLNAKTGKIVSRRCSEAARANAATRFGAKPLAERRGVEAPAELDLTVPEPLPVVKAPARKRAPKRKAEELPAESASDLGAEL